MPAPPRNPYRPGVGRPPLHLAGRDRELAEFHKVLRSAPEIPANVRLTGLRGVGKSVLLGEYRAIAEEENWATATFETQPRHVRTEDDLLATVVSEVDAAIDRLSVRRRAARQIRDVAQRVEVTYADITVSLGAGSSQIESDLSRTLLDATNAALDSGHLGFALLIDEAHIIKDATRGVHRKEGGHPLSALIAAVSGLQRLDVPVGLVLCGLPPLTNNLLKARTYSERMFRAQEIGSLNTADARSAFVEPLLQLGFDAESDLIEAVLDEVQGYPFFIQLYGAELWDAAIDAGTSTLTSSLLGSLRGAILRRLDLEFYAARLESLTQAEQDLLLESVRCTYPPLHVAELRAASAKSDKNVNVLIGRIAEAGTVYRVRQGQYEYTAPKFRDYLVRRSAELQPERADG